MRKRGRLALVLILTAVAILCTSLWVQEGPLWRWVMLKRVPFETLLPTSFEGHERVGWVTVKRWSSLETERFKQPIFHGPAVLYYRENGFKAAEGEAKNGVFIRTTLWDIDGTVRIQDESDEQGMPIEGRASPPWHWGVTDQTEPTAPWWDESR